MAKNIILMMLILVVGTSAFAQNGEYQTNRAGAVVGGRSSNSEVLQAQGPLVSADGAIRLTSRVSLLGDLQFTWWSFRTRPLSGKSTALTGLIRVYPTSRFTPIFVQGGVTSIRNKVATNLDTDSFGVVGIGLNAKRRLIGQLNYVLGPQRGFSTTLEYNHVVGTSPLEFRAKARIGKLLSPFTPTGAVFSDIGIGIGINLDALKART